MIPDADNQEQSGGAAGGLTGLMRLFNRHRTLANLLMILMIAAGVLAFPQMRAQFFPDVVVETVQVGVRWTGAGAEDVDSAIVQPLMPVLATVDGVVATDATSREGQASVRLEFEPGYDMDRAEKAVADAVAGISTLPDDADDPTIRTGGWSERVTDVVITGPVSLDQLARLADDLVGRLFDAGVTRATIIGVAAPSVLVEVPALNLVRHDIGLADIAAAIGREVNADPAGDIGGLARIRTGEARRSVDEIAAIVLRREADASTLTIGDVGLVSGLGLDRARAIYVGDDPAVQIRVDRNAQGDAIAIQDSVAKSVADMQATMPQGVTATLVNSQAEQISGRLALLVDNGLTGLSLVVVLLFLFLNARTALWVAVGIPVAMSAALAAMYMAGLSLNMMSLFALILMLGVVVDDSIIIGEYADFRVTRLGEAPAVASETAAIRMAGPVFSSMVATSIAFFALLGIGGRFGELIADIPLTVIAILIASLFEVFLVLPHHLSHGAVSTKVRWYDVPSHLVNRGFFWFADRIFRPFMGIVIRLRYPVIGAATLLLASQVALVIRGDLPWRFFSPPEQAMVSGGFAMLPAATREDSLEMLGAMQDAARDLGAELEVRDGVNPLVFVTGEIGGNAGRTLAGSENKESWQLGGLSIQLVPADLRPYTAGEFVTMLQERVPQHPMAETVSFRSFGAGPGGDAIDIQLYGASIATLKAAAEALKERLARFPEVSGLEDSLSYDKEELLLTLTPQGEALGLTIDDIGRALRETLNGIDAATYPDGPRTASIRVALPEDEITADYLDRMLIRTPDGAHVPLADLVVIGSRTGFSTIGRENGVIVVSVTGGLADEDSDRAAAILREIDSTILPALSEDFGVGTALSGLAEQERAFLGDAGFAVTLSLIGIYLTLSWIFGSWTRPLVVMSVMPFGLIGAIWGHQVWGIPMSLFTIVGAIGMIGIIVNDSIVLVSTMDEYTPARGLRRALIDAPADRLRPIFLTTATTVIGTAPLLFERSSEAQFLMPTVVTLVYGLGVGSLLVLLVVPSLIAIQSDITGLLAAGRRALNLRHRAIRLPARIGAAVALAIFAFTLLPVLIRGEPLAPIAAALPAVTDSFGAAFALFAALTGIALCGVAVVAYLATGRKRAQPA